MVAEGLKLFYGQDNKFYSSFFLNVVGVDFYHFMASLAVRIPPRANSVDNDCFVLYLKQDAVVSDSKPIFGSVTRQMLDISSQIIFQSFERRNDS